MTHMIELVASEQQLKFGADKRDTLPQYCLECDVRFACHGECPKNRFLTTPDGEPGLNYLCAGFKHFFPSHGKTGQHYGRIDAAGPSGSGGDANSGGRREPNWKPRWPRPTATIPAPAAVGARSSSVTVAPSQTRRPVSRCRNHNGARM
jgi:hypothetical protein